MAIIVNIIAHVSSVKGYRAVIFVLQYRHLLRKTNQLITGIKSRHFSRVLQVWQLDGGDTIDLPCGKR